MLYFNTMQAYLEKKSEHRPSDKFYMIFSTMILFLITIFVATQSFLGQEMWIINAGYPGGALAYFVAHVSAWYQTMGSVASILLQLMTDALLVSVLSVCPGKSVLMRPDSSMLHGLAWKLPRAFRSLLPLVIVSW